MKRRAALAFVVTAIGCALPALLVTYPPLTDLPQHVAQVAQVMRGEQMPGQFVAWWAPNNLVYLPLMLLWWLFAPHRVGALSVVLMSLIWTSATFALAKYLRRPAIAAALASLLFYSGILYWGMLNFVVAWPVFALWWILFDRALEGGRASWKAPALLVAGTCLLFWAHVLALGFAGLSALALTVYDWRRAPWQAHAVRLASFIPAAALAILWAFQLRADRLASGFPVGALWTHSLLDRGRILLTQTASNGDTFETVIVFAALLIWVLGGLLARRAPIRRGAPPWHGRLLVTGLVAALVALTCPDKYFNTIWFAVRWLPWAGVFLLLASPGPPLRKPLAFAFGLVVVVYFGLTTSLNWVLFERTNLTGLSAAIQAVPIRSRVLGLDLLKVSVSSDAIPASLHVVAYAKVERGATINFDFSEHQTGLVRGPVTRSPWTFGLEWFPERLRPTDLQYFEYVLVGSPDPDSVDATFAAWLEPVTHSGVWRLYRSKVFDHRLRPIGPSR